MVTMGCDLASIIIIRVNHHAKVLSLTAKEPIIFSTDSLSYDQILWAAEPSSFASFHKAIHGLSNCYWIQNKEMILYDAPHGCVGLFAES